ncbi:MAG: hypothetical protein AAF196_14315 [Planctomycetota bacterium]
MNKRVLWCLLAMLSLGALSACKSGPERATKVETEDLADDANDQLRRGGGSRDSQGSSAGGSSPEDPQPTPDRVDQGSDLVDSSTPSDSGGDRDAADYPTSWSGVVDDFADRLVQSLDGIEGVVVVFPSFGKLPTTGGLRDCAFGDLVAERIASRVEQSGRPVLTGRELEVAVRSTNRGLSLVTNVASAQAMGRRLSSTYLIAAVVSGEAEVRRTSGIGSSGTARFSLQATAPRRRIPGLPSVPGYTVSRSESEDVARMLEDRGQLRYGRDAAPFEPSLSGELTFTSTVALSSMLSSVSLRGQRVLVQPLDVPRPNSLSLRIQNYAQAFRRAFEATRKSLERAGVEDAYNRVLEGDFKVPSGFESPSFNTTFRRELDDVTTTGEEATNRSLVEVIELERNQNVTPLQALAIYEQMKAEFSVSRLGLASDGFAADVGQALKNLYDGDITIVQPNSRDAAVAQIFADSFAAEVDGSVQRSTISTQSAEAPNFVVQFRLARELDDNHVLRAKIIDLTNANNSPQESVELETWVSRLIDARLR